MNINKLFSVLLIATIIIAFLDLAYLVFAIYLTISVLSSKTLLPPTFGTISLFAIIINILLIGYVTFFLILRKNK